jgi:hypothetical protein
VGSQIDLHDAIAARFSGGASVSISCGSAHQAARAVEWCVNVYAERAQLHLDSMHNAIRIVRRADPSTNRRWNRTRAITGRRDRRTPLSRARGALTSRPGSPANWRC